MSTMGPLAFLAGVSYEAAAGAGRELRYVALRSKTVGADFIFWSGALLILGRRGLGPFLAKKEVRKNSQKIRLKPIRRE